MQASQPKKMLEGHYFLILQFRIQVIIQSITSFTLEYNVSNMTFYTGS